MTPSEDDIKDFFAELKAQDEQVAPPAFTGLPGRKKGRLRYLLPLTAAASVLLLLAFWRTTKDNLSSQTPSEVLVISFGPDQEPPTETLLADPESVYSWESPSASLIADF